MFTKLWTRIITKPAAAAHPDAGVANTAQQLMENAERFAGRTPHYASDLRRAAQAQATLNSYMT